MGNQNPFFPFTVHEPGSQLFSFVKSFLIFFIDFGTDILFFVCERENERLVHEFEFYLLENEVDLCQSCLFYSKYIL